MTSKQRRQGTRMNVNREIDKISPIFLGTTPVDLNQLKLSVAKLSAYKTDLQLLDDAVFSEITDQDKLATEIQNSATYNDNVLEHIARAKPVIDETISQAVVAGERESHSNDSAVRRQNLRLPKLELAAFSGEPLEWQSFWDSFDNSVHKNVSLSEIEKFNYLKGLLAGDALKAIEGYRLTAANYEAVVQTLHERFGDKQMAIFGHFEAMLALPAANHDVNRLQSVADACERHIRSLVALGLDESTFGQVFTPIMLSKLPKFVKIELYRMNGSQAWSLTHLREWLKDEIRARDMGERSFAESVPSGASNPNAHSSQFWKSQKVTSNKSSSASALVSSAPQKGNSPGKRPKPASALVSSAPQQTVKCAFCNDSHFSDQCKKFPDVNSRRQLIQDRCFCCLGKSHQAKQCRRRVPCVHCQKSGHHRSLCFLKFGKKKESDSNANGECGLPVNANITAATTQKDSVANKGKRTIMQTALASLASTNGTNNSARLLFDTAGPRSFITEEKCAELQLPVVGHELVSVAGFQSTKRKTSRYKIVEFSVKCLDGSLQPVTASVVPAITCPIQKIPMDCKKYPVLENVVLADPLIDKPQFVCIDVLIGLDYYYDFVTSDRIQCPDGPLLLSSRLGYIATGRIPTSAVGPETIAVMFLDSNQFPALNNSKLAIERYWDLEEIGMKEPTGQLTGDDDALMKHSLTLERTDSGRYVSRWPWKCDNPELPDNFDNAHGRLTSLLKKLIRNPGLYEKYQHTIREQEESCIIERAPPQPTGQTIYYMPHHCVIIPSKTTTKFRIVYDASSKSRSYVSSLNDCLHRGPVMLENLCGLLLRFRHQPVALVSDIEKAFLQIGLNVKDRDATRFLWAKNASLPPIGDNLMIYRFCRVPFGIISSPFVLENTVCRHLVEMNTDVALKILKNHYVDNVITGETDESAAISHYVEAKQIFRSAGMNLREWYSNSPSVQASFNDSDKGQEKEPKILGIRWNCELDLIKCEPVNHLTETVVTKRQILKTVSQIFDPLGFVAPVTVLGKMLIQELWKGGYDWDCELPLEINKRWKKIVDSLGAIGDLAIPRFVCCLSAGEFGLHVFCDASSKACAAVLYITASCGDMFTSKMLFAKTRLAPTKTNQTIPRLELVAIVIGVRLLTVAEEQLRVHPKQRYIWTDSQCALHWIKREKISARFVENRLEEIRKHPEIQFRFVPSEQNPADLPTRGCETYFLRDNPLWWNGPSWLSQCEDKWPPCEKGCDIEHEIHAVVIPEMKFLPERVVDEQKFSSLLRLFRCTAYVFRFINNVKKKQSNRLRGHLIAEEMQQAEIFWLLDIQNRHFKELVDHQGTTWPKGIGRQLRLFKDNNGILRCAGRLRKFVL